MPSSLPSSLPSIVLKRSVLDCKSVSQYFGQLCDQIKEGIAQAHAISEFTENVVESAQKLSKLRKVDISDTSCLNKLTPHSLLPSSDLEDEKSEQEADSEHSSASSSIVNLSAAASLNLSSYGLCPPPSLAGHIFESLSSPDLKLKNLSVLHHLAVEFLLDLDFKRLPPLGSNAFKLCGCTFGLLR